MTNREKLLGMNITDFWQKYSYQMTVGDFISVADGADSLCDFADCEKCPVHERNSKNCRARLGEWLDEETKPEDRQEFEEGGSEQ